MFTLEAVMIMNRKKKGMKMEREEVIQIHNYENFSHVVKQNHFLLYIDSNDSTCFDNDYFYFFWDWLLNELLRPQGNLLTCYAWHRTHSKGSSRGALWLIPLGRGSVRGPFLPHNWYCRNGIDDSHTTHHTLLLLRSEFERILFQYLSTIPMGELINVLHFCVTAMKIQRKWTENGKYN